MLARPTIVATFAGRSFFFTVNLAERLLRTGDASDLDGELANGNTTAGGVMGIASLHPSYRLTGGATAKSDARKIEFVGSLQSYSPCLSPHTSTSFLIFRNCP